MTSLNRLVITTIALMLFGQATEAGAADFGAVAGPTPPPARVFGGHARGCLAGAEALPADGNGYQIMRLSRNRFWGHPQLIAFVTQFADQVQAGGWPGLLVGDLAQPRGGPMSSGHRSHQSGLDVDIWFLAAPPAPLTPVEREELSAVSMVGEDGEALSTAWTEQHAELLRTAASFPQVDRIFVNPAIKRSLCSTAEGDRDWLGKIRPWWGHDAHFHVGLRCPLGDLECVDRSPAVPPGDGCDSSLEWWFSAAAREELRAGAAAPRPRLSLDELPPACRSVLTLG